MTLQCRQRFHCSHNAHIQRKFPESCFNPGLLIKLLISGSGEVLFIIIANKDPNDADDPGSGAKVGELLPCNFPISDKSAVLLSVSVLVFYSCIKKILIVSGNKIMIYLAPKSEFFSISPKRKHFFSTFSVIVFFFYQLCVWILSHPFFFSSSCSLSFVILYHFSTEYHFTGIYEKRTNLLESSF